MGLFGGGNSDSESNTDNSTNAGYQYGGTGEGFQGNAGGDLVSKQVGASKNGPAFGVQANNGISGDVSIHYEDLSDDVWSAATEFARKAAENAATQMGNAIDANGDAVKRSLDFGDKALEEVSAMSGESLETVRGVVDQALSASDDAYNGALSLLNQNAENTADAFARASGGQAQETQETVRKLVIAFALLMGVTVIAYNWN